jgi:hypothetical protein
MKNQERKPQAGLYEQLVTLGILVWLIGRCLVFGQWPLNPTGTGLSWDL